METIPLGLYIWKRIHQCGVGAVTGVPGDFNLPLLDYIYEVDGLKWVGSTNELNAAYAADGYARAKRGAGCLVTTHGVGELSALNGIAGSMTEEVKVIHIVGQTSREMQKQRLMIHHNIGSNPDHQIFSRASRELCAASAILDCEETATEEVDRVLRACFVESKPVYLYVPVDMSAIQVSAVRLQETLNLEPSLDIDNLRAVTDSILGSIYNAKRPCILVDGLANQHEANQELRELVDVLHVPVFTSVLGKSVVDEDHPYFVGLYTGITTSANVKKAFEACDIVIIVGDVATDINTGGFTRKLAADSTIYIDPKVVRLPGKTYDKLSMRAVLCNLVKHTDSAKVLGIDIPVVRRDSAFEELEEKTPLASITQAWLWPRLAQFYTSGDIVVGETGTASFGIPTSTFPGGIQFFTQAYYGSIGYATPATFGVDIAMQEMHRDGRTILITGDGSLMLTVQEVGNMIKHNSTAMIFIINNAGYTIERAIHGAEKSYNDIVTFDYSCMLQFLGMPAAQAKSSYHKATTQGELDLVLSQDSMIRPSSLQIVEIVMWKLDLPLSLATQLAMRDEAAVGEMKKSGFDLPDVSSLMV